MSVIFAGGFFVISASMEKGFAFPVKRKTKRSHNFSNCHKTKTNSAPKNILFFEINEVLRCLY
jgi:hypothetical protein